MLILLVKVRSIKYEDNRIFWPQNIALKKSMKFTHFIVYQLLKSHRVVWISANFIDF